MERRIKKILAGGLLAAMLVAMLSPVNVFAEDVQTGAEEEIENQQDYAYEQENNIENIEEEPEDGTEAETETQTDAGTETEIQNQTNGQDEISRLEYLYVEKPYLETPAEQNIVVSWGDGSDEIAKFELLYQYNGGAEESFELENKGEGLFLFQKGFTEEESGVYSIVGIRIIKQGQEFTYNLADLGIEAAFGINEYYPGYVAEDTESESSDEGVAVVTEESMEDNTAEKIVEETLTSAGVETEDIGVSVFSLNERSNNGQIVVALDAGHDSTHAGAYGNGVHEEVATLKIAQYCKAELEQYSGVTVYMCRETSSCPYPGQSSTGDIRKRVQASAAQGADVYVSIHLNSGAASANGAEVWYPDSSQTPAMTGPGKNISEKIQAELTKLGLGNRGVKETDDNYACMDEGAKYGLPAVIIEHALCQIIMMLADGCKRNRA